MVATELSAMTMRADSAARTWLDKGFVIADRYRVERRVAETELGVLFEARHVQLDALVLVKVLCDGVNDERATAKLLREARNAARIKSDHVARFQDAGTLPDGRPFVVIEHLEGENFEQMLKRGQKVELATAVDWIIQACRGLAAAHRNGIIHRDLRPSSFFVCTTPEGNQTLKLMSFGTSRVSDSQGRKEDQGLTVAGIGNVLPDYTAPEVFVGATSDPRVDIWSLGAVLFELLTGLRPFAGDPSGTVSRILTQSPPAVSAFRPELPRALDEVILRCLQKQPRDRYESVAELAGALAPFGTLGSFRLPSLSQFDADAEGLLHRRTPNGGFAALGIDSLRGDPAPGTLPAGAARPWTRLWAVAISLIVASTVGVLVARNFRAVRPAPPATTSTTGDSPAQHPAVLPKASSMTSPTDSSPPSVAAPTAAPPSPVGGPHLRPGPRRRSPQSPSAAVGSSSDPFGWKR